MRTGILKKLNIASKQLLKFFRQKFSKIIEINQRYATPRIEMSFPVKLSLLLLRIYLIFLVGLLLYKFITLIK